MAINLDYMRCIANDQMRAGAALYEMLEELDNHRYLDDDAFKEFLKMYKFNRENELKHKFGITMPKREELEWSRYLSDDENSKD